MANDESAIPAFLIALSTLILGQALTTAALGRTAWRRAAVWALGGTALFFFGSFWSKLEPLLGPRLSNSIDVVASNFWVWLGIILLVWLYGAVTSVALLRQRDKYADIIAKDMNPFRQVLQRYVIPRSLTGDQIETIGNHLAKSQSYPVVYVIKENNQEAQHYSRYLQQALTKGGWNTVRIEYRSDVNEGLGYSFDYTEATQRRPETPREPRPDQVLTDAFRWAQVQFNTGGTTSTPGSTQDHLTIYIGERWLELKANPQPWPSEFT